MTWVQRARKFLALPVFVILCVGALVSTCFYSLEPTEFGIARNMATGQLTAEERTGYHLKPPWVFVSVIDTRPVRVCVTTAAHAAFNCRLVRFVKEEWPTFIRVEGFGLYWWANRFSFNFGYKEEYRGMRDIIRGYAFSVEQYPFISVVEEYAQPQ